MVSSHVTPGHDVLFGFLFQYGLLHRGQRTGGVSMRLTQRWRQRRHLQLVFINILSRVLSCLAESCRVESHRVAAY